MYLAEKVKVLTSAKANLNSPLLLLFFPKLQRLLGCSVIQLIVTSDSLISSPNTFCLLLL